MCLSGMEPVPVKGFKVSAEKTNQRKGIACRSLKELRGKICEKFYGDGDEDRKRFQIYTEDGTEVEEDEYLMSLPSNSLLLVSR